jgi:hypothetical protein
MEIEIETYNSYYRENSDTGFLFNSNLILYPLTRLRKEYYINYIIYNWENDNKIYFSLHDEQYKFY